MKGTDQAMPQNAATYKVSGSAEGNRQMGWFTLLALSCIRNVTELWMLWYSPRAYCIHFMWLKEEKKSSTEKSYLVSPVNPQTTLVKRS